MIIENYNRNHSIVHWRIEICCPWPCHLYIIITVHCSHSKKKLINSSLNAVDRTLKSFIVHFGLHWFQTAFEFWMGNLVIPNRAWKEEIDTNLRLEKKGHLVFSRRVHYSCMKNFALQILLRLNFAEKIEGILIIEISHLSQQNSRSRPKGIRLADYANTTCMEL